VQPLRKIVVAMSGGVDSSVAAAVLVEAGFEVVGLFMRVGAETTTSGDNPAPRHPVCCSAADADDARLVAGALGIPFFALNFRADFARIIERFAEEYARGRTPNPCVLCNERLKFGRLLEYARAVGADGVATGHYARIESPEGEPRLLRAADRAKDQSYVLFGLDPDALRRTLFPIGHLSKGDVRRKAAHLGLPVHNKPDSTDICFAPDGDYARIVGRYRPEALRPGEVRDSTGRVVGQHEGIARYTIGQRHGLRIAMGVPMYVTRIDAQANAVTIGPRAALLHDGLLASRASWLIDEPTQRIHAEVQIRYAHAAAAADIDPLPNRAVRVQFHTSQTAVTPGQAAVFYEGDRVLGGAWIDEAL
jgi:tRNA-specific 2-thiouridylase